MILAECSNEIIIIDVSRVNNNYVIRELSYLPFIIFSAKELKFYLAIEHESELILLLNYIKKRYNMTTNYESMK